MFFKSKGMVTKSLAFSLLFFSLAEAEFTPHFRAFLHNTYGVGLVQELERTDLGQDASFGGKVSED